MRKIKVFAALGLLVCGLASYATPALAATNACSHANKKEVGTHMDHWTQKHDDSCTISWTVDRIGTMCIDCNAVLLLYDKQVGTHSDSSHETETIITYL